MGTAPVGDGGGQDRLDGCRSHSVTGMNTPHTVRWSARLWSLAVAAGVAETGLAVTELAAAGGLTGGVWINLAVRALVYIGAAALVIAFAKGRRWARATLVGLLSVLGMAAMVVPSVLLMVGGAGFVESFGSDGELAAAFLSVRMAHIAAVVAATVLMFTATANHYFRAQRPGVEPVRLNPAARRPPGPLPRPTAAASPGERPRP